MPTPFTQPVTEDEPVIAEAEEVLEKLCAQKTLTPRGTL